MLSAYGLLKILPAQKEKFVDRYSETNNLFFRFYRYYGTNISPLLNLLLLAIFFSAVILVVRNVFSNDSISEYKAYAIRLSRLQEENSRLKLISAAPAVDCSTYEKTVAVLQGRIDSFEIETSFKYSAFIKGDVITLKEGRSVFDALSANSKQNASDRSYELFKNISIKVLSVDKTGFTVFSINDKIAGKSQVAILTPGLLFVQKESDHGITILVKTIDVHSNTVTFIPRIRSNI